MDKNKKIKVVSGNGENLNISPVYDHIDIERPKKEKEKKKIVIPKEKKKEFGRASIATHRVMDSKGYFEALESNEDAIDRIEAENTDLPLYDFIMKNCVVDINAIQDTRDPGAEYVVDREAEIEED